jgi:hypothetical protein
VIRILRPAALTRAGLAPWDWCASDRVGTMSRRINTAVPFLSAANHHEPLADAVSPRPGAPVLRRSPIPIDDSIPIGSIRAAVSCRAFSDTSWIAPDHTAKARGVASGRETFRVRRVLHIVRTFSVFVCHRTLKCGH